MNESRKASISISIPTVNTKHLAPTTSRRKSLPWMLFLLVTFILNPITPRLAGQTLDAQQIVGTWERRTPGASGTITSVLTTFRPDGGYSNHIRILYPDNTVKSDFGHRKGTGTWEIKGDLVRVDLDPRPGVRAKAYFFRLDEQGRLVMVGENAAPMRRVSRE
jgi:hypothetical protein